MLNFAIPERFKGWSGDGRNCGRVCGMTGRTWDRRSTRSLLMQPRWVLGGFFKSGRKLGSDLGVPRVGVQNDRRIEYKLQSIDLALSHSIRDNARDFIF
jgi:hypothetical protein